MLSSSVSDVIADWFENGHRSKVRWNLFKRCLARHDRKHTTIWIRPFATRAHHFG